MDVTIKDQTKVYHSTCGPTHQLTNNYAYFGFVQYPQESTYKCEVWDWWQLAYYSYIWLAAANIPAAILLRVPMYYTWGLTLSLQVVSLTPIMRSYLPSCLTFFLKDLMISHATHSEIFDRLSTIYDKIVVERNPLTYRLERHDFVYNSVIFNTLDIFMAWGVAACFYPLFILFRICFFPFHYWGRHFAGLE